MKPIPPLVSSMVPHLRPASAPVVAPTVGPAVVPRASTSSRPMRELDCRAQQCPVPVLRLAKAANELRDGGTIVIHADDPAFPKDLRAWARSAGARITRFDDHGGSFEAVVAVGDEHPSLFELDLSELGLPESEPSPPELEPEPPELEPAPELEPPAPTIRVSQTFDLRGQPSEGLVEVVARACDRAQPGAVLAFIVDDPESGSRPFGDRLEAWLQTVDATLLALDSRGSVTEALVRVEPSIASTAKPDAAPSLAAPSLAALARPAPRAETETPPQRCTLLVLHNDHEALLAALLIANGAATQGMETSVFFTFWGLNLLRGESPNLAAPEPPRPPLLQRMMQRMMKWMMPKGPRRQPLGQMHFGGFGKGMLGAIMRRQQIMSLAELIATAQELGVRFTACTMSMSVMGIAARDLHPYPNLDFGGVASFVDDARRSSIHMVF